MATAITGSPETTRTGGGPFFCFWTFTSAPLDLDEAEREYVPTLLEQSGSGDYSKVTVRAKHQLFFTGHRLIREWYSETSTVLSAPRIQEEVAAFIQMHFPHPIIPDVLLREMMPQVIPYANALAQCCGGTCVRYEIARAHCRLFSLVLVLDIVVQIRLNDERLHDDDIDRIMAYGGYRRAPSNRRRMRITTTEEESTRMVPASKTAIRSLKKVKLQNQNDAVLETCSICLTEFVVGMEVSATPCNHLFHEQCITKWQAKSHLCPLCRYHMATPDN